LEVIEIVLVALHTDMFWCLDEFIFHDNL
jgi:hypothetical protein